MINPSYTGKRYDIMSLVPNNVKKVLDIGCSTGELGLLIKSERQAFVVGVEVDPKAAIEAKRKIDEVHTENIEDCQFQTFGGDFDCIIFADVLEHTKNPWVILREAGSVLSDDGSIIISVPNVQHVTVLKNLIIGLWPVRSRGIFDKTHLRFFTRKSITTLAEDCGLKVRTIKRQYRFIDRPHFINKFAKFLAFPLIRDFLAYQLILVLNK